MTYLVLFDTDRIQEYVFATQKLKAMRGGSLLLEELNRDTGILIKDRGGEEIYLGGGAGCAKFQEWGQAHGFCRDLENKYRDETIIAGISTWIEPAKDGEPFTTWVERAEIGLHRRKEQKDRSLPLVRNPYQKICDWCGRLPAQGKPVESDTFICEACRIQDTSSMRYKHSQMYRAIRKLCSLEVITWPESLEDIGGASTPDGYIGLVYSDGNRMGKGRQRVLQACAPEEAQSRYRQFSECVDQSTRWAMAEAVIAELGSPVPGKPFPVQFFITGGDDMVAAVPANNAMPIALKFAELFEKYYRDGRGNGQGPGAFSGMEIPASVAIGVALAKQNYPLHSLVKTARELLKSAKQRAWREWKDNQQEEVSTIDFLATSSSLLQPLQQQRSQQLQYDQLQLTQRPYTTEEASQLVELIKQLKAGGFPHNKVNQLWQPLYHGLLAASLEHIVLLSRLSDQGSPSPRQALLKVAEAFKLAPFPWRPLPGEYGRYDTPLLDLAELYDFIDDLGECLCRPENVD